MKSIRGRAPQSGDWEIPLGGTFSFPSIPLPPFCHMLSFDWSRAVMLCYDHVRPVGPSTKLSLWGFYNPGEKYHWNKRRAQGCPEVTTVPLLLYPNSPYFACPFLFWVIQEKAGQVARRLEFLELAFLCQKPAVTSGKSSRLFCLCFPICKTPWSL